VSADIGAREAVQLAGVITMRGRYEYIADSLLPQHPRVRRRVATEMPQSVHQQIGENGLSRAVCRMIVNMLGTEELERLMGLGEPHGSLLDRDPLRVVHRTAQNRRGKDEPGLEGRNAVVSLAARRFPGFQVESNRDGGLYLFLPSGMSITGLERSPTIAGRGVPLLMLWLLPPYLFDTRQDHQARAQRRSARSRARQGQQWRLDRLS
jgi:hypothetical protein